MTKVVPIAPISDADQQGTGSPLETGDVFIADTGEYVGKWESPTLSLPVEICMVVERYEYFYKLDRREKREEQAE